MIRLPFIRRPVRAATLCALVLVTACESDEVIPSQAAEPLPDTAGLPVDPALADNLLRETSRRLATEDEFAFRVERHLDAALVEGRKSAEDATIMIYVNRPDKLYVATRGEADYRHLYYNGDKVTVFNATQNEYAESDFSGTIDELVAQLDPRFGFTQPLSQFVTTDLYGRMQSRISAKTINGDTTIAGAACSRLSFSGELAMGDLWVSPETHFPCAFREAYRQVEGRPQAVLEFTMWNQDVELPDDLFKFTPPSDARRISVAPTSE